MVTIGACCVMTCCSTCVGRLCVDVARIMVGCFVKMEDRVVVVVIVGSTGSSSVPLFVILSIVQVEGLLWVLRFPPPIKLTATI
jgi:hypothetical protein